MNVENGKNRNILLIVLACVVLATLICYPAYQKSAADVTCKKRLKAFFLASLDNKQNFRPQVDGFHWEANANREEAAEFLLCPACGKPFQYNPIADRAAFSKESLRIIARCPELCHKDHANALLENGAIVEIKNLNQKTGPP